MTLPGFVVMRRSLSERLIALLVELFRAFTSWSDGDADEFTGQAVPLAEGARRTMADLTSLWIAQQASDHSGLVVPPTAVPDEVLARPGVTSAEVYRRPFVTVRAQLAKGKDVPQSVSVAANRLETIAEGDMQRAHTQAAATAISELPAEAKPIGWRRILGAKKNHCPMCVVASTQLFLTEASNPSHPNCGCSVQLAYGPPEQLDEAGRTRLRGALQALGAKVDQPGGLSESVYRDLLAAMTREHGELGPMLVRPGQHFAGPAQIPS